MKFLFFIIKGVSELWTTHRYVEAGASEVQLMISPGSEGPALRSRLYEEVTVRHNGVPPKKGVFGNTLIDCPTPLFSSARARKSKNWLHSVVVSKVMALKDHVRKIWIFLTFELAVRGQGWELNTPLCLTVTSSYNLDLNAGPSDPGEIIKCVLRIYCPWMFSAV